jgi:Holliday junction resolvasome RuvABC endonuclease subunit
MNKTPNLLALDVATTTGWAMLKDGLISSGFVKFKGDCHGEKLHAFRNWLTETKSKFNEPPFIFFEESKGRHSSMKASQVLNGLRGVLLEWSVSHDLGYIAVTASELKKATTGSGNADKRSMIAAVHLLGYPSVYDDNEADALALLHYAIARRKE